MNLSSNVTYKVNFKPSRVLFVHDQENFEYPINPHAAIKISKDAANSSGQEIKVGVVDDNHENTKLSPLTSIQSVSLQNHVLKSDKVTTKTTTRVNERKAPSATDKLTIKVGVVDDNHENTRYYNPSNYEFWLDKGVFKVLQESNKEVIEKIDLNVGSEVCLRYFTIVKNAVKPQTISNKVRQEV